MTGMDTVSWLSFFTASGLGAALGVLSLTALGACLYLRAPGQRRLAILAAALGCVLVLQYGGGALLEERGLFWRGWVQTALSLTGGGLAVLLLAGTIRGLGALCLGKDWVTAVCVLGCAAALLGAAACAGAGLVGSGGREQVVRLAGETPGGPGWGSAPPGGMALCKFVRAWRAPWPVGGSHKKRGGTQR